MSLWQRFKLKWAEHRKRMRREKWLRSMSELERKIYEAPALIEKYPPPKTITIALEDIPMEERRRQGLPLD